LEDLLDSWPGTMVVVSHDRYLVERVCDTVVALLGDGRITHLPGGIDEYLDRLPAQQASTAPATPPAAPSDAAEQRTARKTLARLERRLDTLHRRITELNEAMADQDADADRLTELDTQLRTVRAEQEDVESEWLLAAEAAGV
jgi:ABC transport system ATP-binding/permease protein